jgi:hypothetical protein
VFRLLPAPTNARRAVDDASVQTFIRERFAAPFFESLAIALARVCVRLDDAVRAQQPSAASAAARASRGRAGTTVAPSRLLETVDDELMFLSDALLSRALASRVSLCVLVYVYDDTCVAAVDARLTQVICESVVDAFVLPLLVRSVECARMPITSAPRSTLADERNQTSMAKLHGWVLCVGVGRGRDTDVEFVDGASTRDAHVLPTISPVTLTWVARC